MFFSSAEYSREKVLKFCANAAPNVQNVLFDCSQIFKIDFTAGKVSQRVGVYGIIIINIKIDFSASIP